MSIERFNEVVSTYHISNAIYIPDFNNVTLKSGKKVNLHYIDYNFFKQYLKENLTISTQQVYLDTSLIFVIGIYIDDATKSPNENNKFFEFWSNQELINISKECFLSSVEENSPLRVACDVLYPDETLTFPMKVLYIKDILLQEIVGRFESELGL